MNFLLLWEKLRLQQATFHGLRIYVKFEGSVLKHAQSKDDLVKAADNGLKQIFDKKYANGLFEKRFKLESIVCAGLSFFGKECYLSMKLVKRSYI